VNLLKFRVLLCSLCHVVSFSTDSLFYRFDDDIWWMFWYWCLVLKSRMAAIQMHVNRCNIPSFILSLTIYDWWCFPYKVNVNMKQRLSNIGPFRKNLFQYPCHQRSLSVKVICCPLQIEYDVRVNCFDMVLSITACIRGTETPEHDLQPSTASALYYFYK